MKQLILVSLIIGFISTTYAQMPNYEKVNEQIPVCSDLHFIDFDNDGFLDIISYDAICKNEGNNTFTKFPINGANLMYYVEYTDIDNDNDIDIINYDYSSIIVYENKGNNVLVPKTIFEGDCFFALISEILTMMEK